MNIVLAVININCVPNDYCKAKKKWYNVPWRAAWYRIRRMIIFGKGNNYWYRFISVRLRTEFYSIWKQQKSLTYCFLIFIPCDSVRCEKWTEFALCYWYLYTCLRLLNHTSYLIARITTHLQRLDCLLCIKILCTQDSCLRCLVFFLKCFDNNNKCHMIINQRWNGNNLLLDNNNQTLYYYLIYKTFIRENSLLSLLISTDVSM